MLRERENRSLSNLHRERDPMGVPGPDTAPSTPGAGVATSEVPRTSVLINCGIHEGNYPVMGMTVIAAREFLSGFCNIDPESVAVIEGEVVEDEDERVIGSDVHLLSFVKSSSVKG